MCSMRLSLSLQAIGPTRPVLAARKRRWESATRILPRLLATVLVGVGSLMLPLPLAAFAYFPFGTGQALKWGTRPAWHILPMAFRR